MSVFLAQLVSGKGGLRHRADGDRGQGSILTRQTRCGLEYAWLGWKAAVLGIAGEHAEAVTEPTARQRGWPMAKKSTVQVRRVYENRAPGDGTRVLVDRLWPRAMAKADVDFDEWCKKVAPSTELRKRYAHDPERFEEFERRYKTESTQPVRTEAFDHLHHLLRQQPLTLLTATKHPEISAASILAALLRD